MAKWPTNPDWIPISTINGGNEIQGGDGFTASDQNKIIQNLLYLYQHLDLGADNVKVGTVSTSTSAAGTAAAVSISLRTVEAEPNTVYLDFAFLIPRGNTGATGTNGKDTLEFKVGIQSATAKPTAGKRAVITNLSLFNRTPVQGEYFGAYSTFNNKLYYERYSVTSVQTSSVNILTQSVYEFPTVVTYEPTVIMSNNPLEEDYRVPFVQELAYYIYQNGPQCYTLQFGEDEEQRRTKIIKCDFLDTVYQVIFVLNEEIYVCSWEEMSHGEASGEPYEFVDGSESIEIYPLKDGGQELTVITDDVCDITTLTAGLYMWSPTGTTNKYLKYTNSSADNILITSEPFKKIVVIEQEGNYISFRLSDVPHFSNDADYSIIQGLWDSQNNYGSWRYQGDNVHTVSYAQLKNARQTKSLIPGNQYRIWDYTTTTSQVDTRSAGHAFSVIVTALSNDQLSEVALCRRNPSSKPLTEYFAKSKVEAWKIKYCFDNDTSRFSWADPVNGKGVIYWMQDEFGNECPYDFKNIQFKRYSILEVDGRSFGEQFCANEDYSYFTDCLAALPSMYNMEIDDSEFVWCYTFNWFKDNDTSQPIDMSLQNWYFADTYVEGDYWRKFVAYGNKMDAYYVISSIDEDTGIIVQSLNNIVFTNYDEDALEKQSYQIFDNVFNPGCHDMSFGKKCYGNFFQNDCGSNTFGNSCDSNTFGNDCGSNTFGNFCYSNTFGNSCYSNTFGNSCGSNTFGSYVQNAAMPIDFVRYNIIDNGIQYINLNGTGTASYANQLQNVHIHQGVKGASSSNRKNVTVERGSTDQINVQTPGTKTINV